jgi:hypothetical protein
MTDQSAVRLDLRFTGPAQTNSAARLLQVRPHARQSGQHVLELRELHLHLRLARARTRREDVENDLGPVHDARPELELDVLPLRRRQLVVEDHQRRADVGDAATQLLQLSLPEIRRRTRTIDQLREFPDDFSARRVGQTRQLLEMLRQEMAR